MPIGPARLKCALLGYKVLQGAVTGSAVSWPEDADVLAPHGQVEPGGPENQSARFQGARAR